MGTRASIHFHKSTFSSPIFFTIYSQSDGYVQEDVGRGYDIYRVLGYRKLVNGITDAYQEVNGIEDAAALLLAFLKRDMEAGNIYVTMAHEDEEFTYHIWVENMSLYMSVNGHSMGWTGEIRKFEDECVPAFTGG